MQASRLPAALAPSLHEKPHTQPNIRERAEDDTLFVVLSNVPLAQLSDYNQEPWRALQNACVQAPRVWHIGMMRRWVGTMAGATQLSPFGSIPPLPTARPEAPLRSLLHTLPQV
jgi:hypothetical protein